MTSSYSGDPGSSSKDAVRFWVGDISSPFEVTDEEINYTVGIYPNAMLAAANIARRLQATYAKKPSKRVGDLSISYSDIAAQYAKVAEQLESQGASMGVAPYTGGISVSDKQTVEDNTDRSTPPFSEGQFNNNSGPNNTTAYDDGFSDGS